jgi:hypothetical protein
VAPGQKIIPRWYCCQPICDIAITPGGPENCRRKPVAAPGKLPQSRSALLTFRRLCVYQLKSPAPAAPRLRSCQAQKVQYLCGFQTIPKQSRAAHRDMSSAVTGFVYKY